MSFALSAIVLIILMLPGIVVYKAYYTSLKEKNSLKEQSFSDQLSKGFLISIVIHGVGLLALSAFFEVHLPFLYNILISKEMSESDQHFLVLFSLQFIFYNIILMAGCFVLTKWFRRWAINRGWDTKYNLLQINNYWYQIFSARFLDEPGVPGQAKDTDLVYVDVLTRSNTIYSGFIENYFFSEEKGELQNVVLTHVRKQPFSFLDENEGKAIPCEFFVIPFSEILNINVTYLQATFE